MFHRKSFPFSTRGFATISRPNQNAAAAHSAVRSYYIQPKACGRDKKRRSGAEPKPRKLKTWLGPPRPLLNLRKSPIAPRELSLACCSLYFLVLGGSGAVENWCGGRPLQSSRLAPSIHRSPPAKHGKLRIKSSIQSKVGAICHTTPCPDDAYHPLVRTGSNLILSPLNVHSLNVQLAFHTPINPQSSPFIHHLLLFSSTSLLPAVVDVIIQTKTGRKGPSHSLSPKQKQSLLKKTPTYLIW